MEYGQRHPESVKREKRMILGMLMVGLSFLMGNLMQLAIMGIQLHPPRFIYTVITVLGNLLFLAGLILTALQIPNIAIKVLILVLGSLIFVVYSIQTLL